MLAIAEPVKHPYLVDTRAADSDAISLIEQTGAVHRLGQQSSHLVGVMAPDWALGQFSTLRAAHEAAIRDVVERSGGSRCQRWREHNMARLRDLEQVVGRPLPQPGYLDELLAWRSQEAGPANLSELESFPAVDRELLEYIADAIEQAHAVNPKSWSVYQVKAGGLVLNVSSYTAALITQERGSWVLAGNASDPNYEDIAALRKETFATVDACFLVFVDERRELRAIAATYQQEFLQAVRDLATKTTTITPRASEFQPHVLAHIAQSIDRVLPSPAYLETTPMPTSDDAMSWISKLDSVLLEQIARDLKIADGIIRIPGRSAMRPLPSCVFTSETKLY